MRHARVRHAIVDDVGAIHAIYMQGIEAHGCALRLDPGGGEAMRAWIEAREDAHPVFVAEMGGEIVGWASLSRPEPRGDEDHSAEVRLFVRQDHRGYGLGRLLLSTLISRGRELGHRALVSSVAADQLGVLSLHRSLGFEEVGRLDEMARSGGQRVDVVYFELLLEPEAPEFLVS